MNSNKKNSKQGQTGAKRAQVGRPRELRLSSQAKGIIGQPLSDCQQYEEHQGNDKVAAELIFQFPLHLKCISNTIRQVDKNGKLCFIFLPDQVILSYGDIQNGSMQNKCFLRIKCQNILSYFFNYTEQGFIKFSIPISHIANSYAFYNRSSVKTEMRVFGPQKPLMRIDSYKSEKRKLQKITNTISVRMTPSAEDVNAVTEFIDDIINNQKSITNRSDPSIVNLVQDISQLSQNEQITAVLKSSKLFNNCFFIKYKQLKVYSFALQNQDIRKFITEVQKDCQTITIIRELTLSKTQSTCDRELKQIVLKSMIPGSGSQKKLENPPSLIQQYKVFKELPEELAYNVSANILKQISANNPNCMIQFIMLDNSAVVLKIRDKDATCTFKFLVHSQE